MVNVVLGAAWGVETRLTHEHIRAEWEPLPTAPGPEGTGGRVLRKPDQITCGVGLLGIWGLNETPTLAPPLKGGGGKLGIEREAPPEGGGRRRISKHTGPASRTLKGQN